MLGFKYVKQKNNKILVKVVQVPLLSLLSFILLNSLIFFIQIIHPAPSWGEICLSNGCGKSEQFIISNAYAIYQQSIPKIFYGLSLLFVTLLYFFKKKDFLKYIFLFLAIQCSLFAFFSTRGHQWYFEFGTEPPAELKSFLISLFLLLIFYWGYKKIKLL